MRIKLPKLLVMIIRKRREKKCNRNTGDANTDKGKKKKDSVSDKSRSRNGEGSSNGGGMEEAITVIQGLLEIDESQTGNDNGVCIDDHRGGKKVEPGIGKSTLSISRSFREMLHNVGKSNGWKDSVGVQVMSEGRKSAIFNKANPSKTSNCNALIIPSATSRDTNVSRNQKCSKVTPRSPTSKPRGRQSRHGKESARKAPKEEENTMELCKKRILMGKRCRSLNRSGSLQYDEKGILLPEDIIPAEI